MEDTTEQLESLKKVGILAAIVSLVLVGLIVLQHNLSLQKKGTVVLPAGGTYLGPSKQEAAVSTPPPPDEPTPTPSKGGLAPTKADETAKDPNKFSVRADAPWVEVRGKKYAYSFMSPKSLTLVTFPNDQYDIYAISWKTFTPESNVLIGVDNLNASDDKKKYVSVSKRIYVSEWWKQFGGLKGIASIVEFTNSKGLKGYRAKFINTANQTPNEDIFFEVPGNPEYVIHLANGVLDKSVFDRIVDTVGWK